MKFYTFGNRENPVILLLPGTCCHWKSNFNEVIPLLESKFYVVCVSYDGFDETENAVFPDMITETQKIEEYIRANFSGFIQAAYGCSLGGSFVGLLAQRKKVRIAHAIVGSSDLDQAGKFKAMLQAFIVSGVLSKMIHKGELPQFMKKRLAKKSEEEKAYLQKMLALFGVNGEKREYICKRSIRNQFYSDLITPLDDKISAEGTTIHVFYATKMGEKYHERYLRHFKDPDMIRQNLRHEELLVCYPEKWAKEVFRCCGV